MTRMTYAEVAEEYPRFSEEDIKCLVRAMNRTWDIIASDCVEFMDDPYDDETIVELVVDAGRMHDYGGTEDSRVVTDFYNALREDPHLYPDLPRKIWNSIRPGW